MLLNECAYIFFEKVLDSSFDEIFITDDKGNIIYARESNEKMFGVPYEKFIHQNVFELEKAGIFVPSAIASVLREKKEVTIVQETRNKNKLLVSAFPTYDENEKLIGAVSFSRDVTEFERLKEENDQVAKAIQQYRKEIESLKKQTSQTIYLKNSEMNRILDIVNKVADLDITVLIDGESGVGKNHLAERIHGISSRREEPFIEVNCGAIAESLIESELFGYEDGAFTGAKKGGKKGYFESAGKGTLFLDEIGELPMNLQVKFLSVLQNQSFMRVGGSQRIKNECRIICATNQDLEKLIEQNKFREDLYYRINVIKLTIPPLRERRDELITLIYEITEEFNRKYGMDKHFSTEVIAWLSNQEWPGNIRELRNFIEKAIIVAETNEINVETIELITNGDTRNNFEELTLNEYLEKVEKDFIKQVYSKYPNSIELGKKLGISQSTANRKIRKYIDLVNLE